jgi:hypothetical protein
VFVALELGAAAALWRVCGERWNIGELNSTLAFFDFGMIHFKTHFVMEGF